MSGQNHTHIFDGLFEPSLSKYVGIAMSAASIVFHGPLIWFIVWQEKNGPDLQQTLLNKLIASICAVSLLYLYFGQVSGQRQH
jgi:hypothetical protein